ncbi:hypothetical protein H1R20_g7412, partial [Candolleomyces eurysporus]
MFFSNESKYRRCKPSSNLCHIVAFFDKLSPDFKDYVTKKTGGRIPPKSFMSHCKNEMFHAQWQILLDDELLEAIRHGIVIMCQDGIERRFYIRIFTYSADYPEKVLIATIRSNGGCPCPRCLITKDKLDQLGTEADRTFCENYARRDDASRQSTVEEARIKVFNDGAAISGTHVERLLKPESLQPVMNAFSVRLKSTNFDIFSALVVDLMHEFEIGVWKSLFIHLVRILEASSKHEVLVHELDRRYRLVPRFGTSVRRFSENVSEFKRKAARDYEQLLQCAIPVFDGLVPHEEHSREILLILLSCAKWHALAKLRLHTDATLDLLDEATIKLGNSFRQFIANVCSQIQTKELAIEVAKRVKREQKKAASKAKLAKDKATADESGPSTAPPAHCALPSTSAILEAPYSANPLPSLPEPARVIKANKSRSGRSAVLSGSWRKSKETKGKLRTSNRDVDQAERTSITQPSSATFTAASDTISPSGLLESNQEMPVVPMVPEASSSQPSESGNQQGSSKGKSVDSKSKPKLVALNIQTPKFHFLGDYVKTIRTFGTCDSFTTEVGELMHRLPKKWYRRSSKKKICEEVVRHERKAAHIRAIRTQINASKETKKQIEEQRRAARKADIHHHIGINENYPISLLGLSSIGEPQPSNVEADPLGKTFLSDLRDHLLPRMASNLRARYQGQETHGTIPSLDPLYLAFKDHRIFSHKIMRLKYTTYDVRRDEDVIHVNSDVCNIMIPNPQYGKDALAHHPYLYARVLGIYHAHVYYVGEAVSGVRDYTPIRMEFLRVRWYSSSTNPTNHLDSTSASLPELDTVVFPSITSPDAISFIDPNVVLRASHIIPRFCKGRVYKDGRGKSEMAGDGFDWKEYYINRFVDRDMFMRYQINLGVGHWTKGQSSHHQHPSLKKPSEPVLPVLPPPQNISFGQEAIYAESSRAEELDIEKGLLTESLNPNDKQGNNNDNNGDSDSDSDRNTDTEEEGRNDEVHELDEDEIEMHGY